jgi:hypothetical protein
VHSDGELEEIDRIDESTVPSAVQLRDGAFTLQGLRAYTHLSETDLRVTCTKTLNQRGSPTTTQEGRATFTPPRRLSEQAFSVTDELLAEMGVLGELGADDWESDDPGA